MSVGDLIVMAILLFGAYQGFKKGFLQEFISIAAFILGIIGAFKLLHWGMQVIGSSFKIDETLLPYISFIVLFIGIIFLVRYVGKTVKKIVDKTILGSVDKLTGAGLSLIKWAFGISVLLWLSNSIGIKIIDDWINDSLLLVYIEPIAPQVVNALGYIMPFAKDLFESIKEYLQSGPPA